MVLLSRPGILPLVFGSETKMVQCNLHHLRNNRKVLIDPPIILKLVDNACSYRFSQLALRLI